jgi:hypothetical protein
MKHKSLAEYGSELSEIAVEMVDAERDQEAKLISRVLCIVVDELPQCQDVCEQETVEIKKLAVQIVSNINSEPDTENIKSEFANLFEQWDERCTKPDSKFRMNDE